MMKRYGNWIRFSSLSSWFTIHVEWFSLFRVDFCIIFTILWYRITKCSTVREITTGSEAKSSSTRFGTNDFWGAEHDWAHGAANIDTYAEFNTMSTGSGTHTSVEIFKFIWQEINSFFGTHFQILLVHEASKGSFSRVFDFEANDVNKNDTNTRTSPFESRFPINIGVTGYVATRGDVSRFTPRLSLSFVCSNIDAFPDCEHTKRLWR